MTSTNNNLHNNNAPSFTADTSGSVFSNFGVYQQTPVGLSELSIRTLVPDPISADPCRKALIVNLSFHKILSLYDSPPVSFNKLIATVSSYFDIRTGSAERDTETASQSIYRSFFQVSNLIGVTFSDTSGKPVEVPDTDSHPADVTYFTFRSTVSANTVDCHPSKNI